MSDSSSDDAYSRRTWLMHAGNALAGTAAVLSQIPESEYLKAIRSFEADDLKARYRSEGFFTGLRYSNKQDGQPRFVGSSLFVRTTASG